MNTKYAIFINWKRNSNHFSQVRSDILAYFKGNRVYPMHSEDLECDLYYTYNVVEAILCTQDLNKHIANIKSAVDGYQILRITDDDHMSVYW